MTRKTSSLLISSFASILLLGCAPTATEPSTDKNSDKKQAPPKIKIQDKPGEPPPPPPAVPDDSCEHAKDDVCDEPGGFCLPGTDTTDCKNKLPPGDTCQHANDEVCDEPQFCQVGTDKSDCENPLPPGDTCAHANDGVCDEPTFHCAPGTDMSDCSDDPVDEPDEEDTNSAVINETIKNLGVTELDRRIEFDDGEAGTTVRCQEEPLSDEISVLIARGDFELYFKLHAPSGLVQDSYDASDIAEISYYNESADYWPAGSANGGVSATFNGFVNPNLNTFDMVYLIPSGLVENGISTADRKADISGHVSCYLD